MPDDQAYPAIEVRQAERQVLVGGHPAPLGARAFDLLMALYERRERVVSKNELLDLVWPGLVVEENNLQVQVSSLRKALGPAAIATIPGRGYRFTLPQPALVQHTTTAPASPAPTPAHETTRTNLPAAPPLFGRAADLAAAAELMRTCPVISIVGAGGIGKTRLALALAAADRHDAPDGRWWVELAVINEASQVAATIASTLGLRLPASRPPLEMLAEALAPQRVLLVLDNCEHLAEAVAPLVAALRAAAPGVRLLITSQESLKCVDEQVYRLGSLAVPSSPDLEEASRCGAVALFVARAHAVDPRFRLGPDNVAAVIEICRRLDGIPLAIELAAARVPLLGVEGLQARLDQMFNVLTGVARMKLRRHQTLRAALEWSYGLLSGDERAVFRRLGAFAGGFTLELAQAVARDESIDEWHVLDVLAQLIDKSLVIAEGEGEPRYRLLETTRAYALEQLALAGESASVLRRHAEAVAAAMTVSEELQWSEPYRERLRRLREIGNLRAALDWATSPGGDPVLACRLLGKGWFQWVGNCVPGEGLERMLRLLPLPDDVPPDAEAAFGLGLASLRFQGNLPARDEIVHAARRSVDLYRELGDQRRLADALFRVASIRLARGETDAASEPLQEATALIGDTGPLRQQASLAAVAGLHALAIKDFETASTVYRRQAELYRRNGDEMGQYLALSNLAMVALDVGDIDGAIDGLYRAIDGLRRIAAPYGIGESRTLLAVALAIRGDDVDVLSLARQAFDHVVALGGEATFRPLMAAALHHARHGDIERAALVAGYASAVLEAHSTVGRGVTTSFCPIDVRLQQQLVAVTASSGAGASIDAWRQAGQRLSQSQAAALAFDGAPLDGLDS